MSKPIPVSQATAMIKTYNSYMSTLGVDMKKQTQSVSFSLPELMAWLNKMTAIADEIRIFMGDYPDGAPEAGRTTVVLWPYKDGKPAKTTDKSLYTETDPELPPDDEEGGGEEGGGEDEDEEDGEEGGEESTDPDPGEEADPYNDGQTHP